MKKFIKQMIASADLKRATEGYSDLAILYENWDNKDQAYATYFAGLGLDNEEAISKSTLLFKFR